MKKIKFVFMLSLILSALCLTSCSERIDAGSEGILVTSMAPTRVLMTLASLPAVYGTIHSLRRSMSIQRSFRQSTTLHSPSTPRMAPNSLWILPCH